MKPSTLNILFSDVFSVLPEWPTKPPLYFTHYVCNGQVAETGQRAAELYLEACKQSKAKAIKIDNADGIICTVEYTPEGVHRTRNGKVLRNGDVFHVDGFKYELKHKNYQGFLSCCPKESDCSCGKKVAILKLVKEDGKQLVLTATEKYKYETDAKFREDLLSGLIKTDEQYERERIQRHVKGLAKEEEPKHMNTEYYVSEQMKGVTSTMGYKPSEIEHLVRETYNDGYNQAIDDVLKIMNKAFEIDPNGTAIGNLGVIVGNMSFAIKDIEKLKK
jgi:hypothetical protein